MKMVLVLVVLLGAMVACNDGGDNADNVGGLPTVGANSGAHNGGGFHASSLVCSDYCGDGPDIAFLRGLSPTDLCERAICFVDDACLYGCPDDLVLPICPN